MSHSANHNRMEPQNRHQEFLKFLRQLDKEVPGKELHLVLDNYGTHKHEKVQRWLKRHQRFHLHFTPTGVPPREAKKAGLANTAILQGCATEEAVPRC